MQLKHIFTSARKLAKPTSSETLTAYLIQTKEPPWTSYFVKVCYLYTFIIRDVKTS